MVEFSFGKGRLCFFFFFQKGFLVRWRTVSPRYHPSGCSAMTGSAAFVALVVSLRLLNAILVTTQLDPDEWWQAPEVAHRLVFGCGVLTWEWEHGLRGYTHVLPLALGMQALKTLRFDSPLAIAMLPRLMQGVLAAVGDLLLRRLATRYFGSNEAGRCALLSFTTSWFVAICGVRTYSSTAEATLLLAALCLLPLPGMSKAPSWWCHSLPLDVASAALRAPEEPFGRSEASGSMRCCR